MEETTEEKLNKEINAPAIDILKAVGFTSEFTDLGELCRKLGLVTFADFRGVTREMIAGAELKTTILERKLAQLCEQCADVEAYKRWRRRTLTFLASSAAEVAATQRARAEEEERKARIRQWASDSKQQDESLRALLLRLEIETDIC
jgi:hypothetical protein